MRYLELNAEGVVRNIVIWDGVSPYMPEGVIELLPCDEHKSATFGWKYENGKWISPQPFPSWTLDENFNWQPPTPMPDDGTEYVWDEATLVWQPVPEESESE